MRTTLLALVATSLLGACVATVGPGGPPPAGPPSVEHRRERPIIEGTVFDVATHQPIDRAGIDITGPGLPHEVTVNTGPDGRFRADDLPRGELGLRCRREGYLVVERRMEVREGVNRVTFELQRR
jgi:hypothetical protein